MILFTKKIMFFNVVTTTLSPGGSCLAWTMPSNWGTMWHDYKTISHIHLLLMEAENCHFSNKKNISGYCYHSILAQGFITWVMPSNYITRCKKNLWA